MAISVISAAVTKYNALTAANFPSSTRFPLSFDGVPAVTSTGVQLRVPFANLEDEGTAPEFDFEHNAREVTTFTLTLYALSLGDCDTAAEAVKYNGGGVTGGSGFDFGTYTLTSGTTNQESLRLSERRYVAGEDPNGARVHAVELKYRVTVERSS